MPERPEPVAINDEIFAYAAGALEDAPRARVELLLENEPAMRARLAWYEAVCDSIVQTLPTLDALPTPDQIIERVRGRTAKRGFFAWLLGPGLKPAAATMALFVVAQSAVIALLALERADNSPVRSASPAAQPVFLVVAFDPQASEAAIRALLLQAGATIVDGPKQLGEYRLAVGANRAQFARSLLEQSKIVEYVRPETQ